MPLKRDSKQNYAFETRLETNQTIPLKQDWKQTKYASETRLETNKTKQNN